MTTSKESYELQALILQHTKMEASYREIFHKVCNNLVHDLIVRLQQEPQNAPMYTVEVFSKEGTDSQACKDHILATTGMVPAIYDYPDYTVNSIVTIDGKYVFSLPAGVYRFTAAFPDGTNHIINGYAVWPGSTHALDFKYWFFSFSLI